MSILKKLNLTAHAKKSARIVDPVIRSRQKLLHALDVQQKIYEAEQKGETLSVERMRWRSNEDGERIRVPVKFQPKRWWWTEDDVVYFAPKVGVRALHIQANKPTIQVGELAQLPSTLSTIKEAVEAGELDKQIAEANSRTKSK